MFDVRCDVCDSLINLDFNRTIKSYYKDMDYVVDESGNIKDSSLQKYMIYKCSKCGKVYKFTFRELELRIRRQIAKTAMSFKRNEAFKNIKPNSIDPDNGFEYCGKCPGYDGEGNCFIDVMNQCIIRNSKRETNEL